MKTRFVSTLAVVTTLFVTGCSGGGGIDINVEPSFRPFDWIQNTDFLARESFNFNVSSADRARLVLSGVNGDIVITGGPSGGDVTITGERRVGSASLADAQTHLPELAVEVQEAGSDILVRTQQPQNTAGRSYVVDYRITVPTALTLSIAGVNGSVALNGITGIVESSLVNGRTEASLQLRAGNKIELTTVNGDIDLHLPLETSADLSAKVSIGSIQVHDLLVQNEMRSNTSLQGTLGSGGASVSLRTTNGSIRIDGVI